MVSAPSLIAIITGPTASGKTGLALQFATEVPEIEIINADSMLVYRGMDIGTAKPTRAELESVPHHLIDIRNPDEPFSAGDFVRATEAAIQDIESRGKRPLIVGGTGFYLKALLYGMWETPPTDPDFRKSLEDLPTPDLLEKIRSSDPESADRIGPSDRYRLVRALELIHGSGKTLKQLQSSLPQTPNPRYELFIVDRSNEELHSRIHERTRAMLDAGLIAEVEKIRHDYRRARGLDAVGYAQVCQFLADEKPVGRKTRPGLAGLADEIELATRQLVKRQRTWFRGQKEARWFELDHELPAILSRLRTIYASRNSA